MSTATDHVEREVKLSVGPDFELPDLRPLVGNTLRLPEQNLDTAYFDTADLRLWCQGLTLRHRRDASSTQNIARTRSATAQNGEDHLGMWTLKVPEGESGGRLDRTEIGWPGDRRTIPPEATAIVRGLVRRRDLIQVTELSTIRRRLVLHDAEGSAWAELDDDTVTITHGPRDGRQFRQLEVELLGDHRDGVDAVVSALQRAGGRTGNREKLATALDLKARDPAATNRGRQFTGRAVLGEVVQASITSGLGRLLDHDYRLRLDPTNPRPDDIHQARVATRRLRSDLKTLADTLDPIWVNHTRSELRWLGTALGSVRDIDVLSADLGCSTTGTPFEIAGDLAIRARLELQRHKACNELAALLVSSRYLDLLDRLHAASLHPPFLTQAGRRSKRAAAGQPADQALPRLVRIRQKALRRQVGKAGRNPSDHDLHRVRIRAKQLRYASETAAPILGKSARRTAAAAENLQSVLGKHHDAVTAQQWLRRQARAAGAQPAEIFRAGQLASDHRYLQRQQAKRWRHAWKAVSTKNIGPRRRRS